ncbi:hypothetical protein ARMGADRAFT_692755 [Armillaria gallica]|uniref:Uncharacterized protein n=1 Tax=Armillaria gallica TaxID=47427 RepID=A0A2H3DY26_ARMGA|nr:hypothetical protein ARMGADRAFT_692755 [Armillaria gallica]
MSLLLRARCVHVTDVTVVCPRPWFNIPSLPSLEHLSCVDCGHGIHAHVDFKSKVVFHNPTTHCAAYAQRLPIASLLYSTWDSRYSHCRRINLKRVLAPSPNPPATLEPLL